jgi:serine O-acetyltransferase
MLDCNPADSNLVLVFTNISEKVLTMLKFIISDLERTTRKEKYGIHKATLLFFDLGFHAVLLYRIGNWFYRHKMLPVAVIISYLGSVFTGAQISHRAKIGKGFQVMHPHGVVVGATAAIGENCQLTSGVVIGQRYSDGNRPVIGNYFVGGTGAKILGKIIIGDFVQVGANSVVLNDLPSHVTAVGVPAKIVANNKSEQTTLHTQLSGQEGCPPEFSFDPGLYNSLHLKRTF